MTESTSSAPDPQIDTDYRLFQEGKAFCGDTPLQIIELTGRDRASFLHNFCTNDIKSMSPGDAREAFILDGKGKTVAFLQVLATPDSLLLLSHENYVDAVASHLERFIIVENVEAKRVTDRTVVVCGWRDDQNFAVQLGSQTALALTNNLAEFEANMAKSGRTQVSNQVYEAIRIENRFPIGSQDVSSDNLAQEFERNEHAIHFNKGCYLGQETVARLDALGHTNKSLVQIKLSEPLPTGTEFPVDVSVKVAAAPQNSPETTDILKVAGKVLSATWSPGLQCHLALAMVRKPHQLPGTQVQVDKIEGTIN